MTRLYGVVFLAAIIVDVIPQIAPSAWLVIPLCALGSTLGWYLMSPCIHRFADLFIKRCKTEERAFLGKKLSQSLWPSWVFVFIYAVTPLSTTALFTAVGVAKVKPLHTVPPYFCGKLLSHAATIFTGLYAAANLTNLVHGAFFPRRGWCRWL